MALNRPQQARPHHEPKRRSAERLTADSASLGVVVEALGARAAAWYRHNGFAPFPDFPLHLIMRMQDIRAL